MTQSWEVLEESQDSSTARWVVEEQLFQYLFRNSNSPAPWDSQDEETYWKRKNTFSNPFIDGKKGICQTSITLGSGLKLYSSPNFYSFISFLFCWYLPVKSFYYYIQKPSEYRYDKDIDFKIVFIYLYKANSLDWKYSSCFLFSLCSGRKVSDYKFILNTFVY